MDIGVLLDSDYREGQTEQEAFAAALSTADLVEQLGFDAVWLAERHFSPPGGTALIPSVGSAPMLLATAIAARTRRVRIGTAVLLLPLGHPVRLAEEVATLDHLSLGRLELGIGRSSFARAYEGYNIAYEESRARFREYLEIMRLAWTQPRFSYKGRFYACRDLEVVPKPYQRPYPPLHQAAAMRDTFTAIGSMGLALLVALVGTPLSEVAGAIAEYQAAWQAAGHPGRGPVRLRLPIYVAETRQRAHADPCASLLAYYERLRQGYLRSGRRRESAALARLTYEQLLQERVVFGTPSDVVARLQSMQQALGLSGIIVEPNPGGGLPMEYARHSMALFAHEVAPKLRQQA
jgi:alkanesulfonate monooxygenase SsuD/methylene tetrahydromethanopterin reductase-like flavin-dependent oxidoreductase (luciferase family)